MKNKYNLPKGSLISFMSNKVKLNGGINFAQGIPGYQPPIELLNIASEEIKGELHQYAPGIGNFKLRELILSQYAELGYANDNLLITQGATEAISLIFQYLVSTLETNFSAMAFEPVYESYKHLPRIHNINFISYNFNLDKIKELEKIIVKNNVKVIFVNSPGNPFGKIYSKIELQEIMNISHQHNVNIIIDAVYRELYFNNPPYYPMNPNDENLFYINSFSKKLSITGWRIGYLLCSKTHMEQIRDIHDYIGLCANAPLQEALAKYLTSHDMGKGYISFVRDKLRSTNFEFEKKLCALQFQIPKVQGGYYVWAKLPNNIDGFEFAIDLYDKMHVSVVPGIHFSDSGGNYVRFNIARESDEIELGLSRIQEYFDKFVL